MNSKLTFLHCLSPLHPGTGQGVGAIDLPVAREKATNLPFLPGSSVKGSLRDQFNDDPDKRDKIFGPEKSADFAGAIQFTDQTLLCLPVRSLSGTFAYVTSPYVLNRLRRDAIITHDVPEITDTQACVIGNGSALRLTGNDVCLEDLDLRCDVAELEIFDWIAKRVFVDNADWQAIFKSRFCVVSDKAFGFLLSTGTEVTARIRLNDQSKTTVDGALWYEESLPTESILYGLALAFPNKRTGLSPSEVFDAVISKCSGPLQFGGNATVGRGICSVRFAEIGNATTAGAGGHQ